MKKIFEKFKFNVVGFLLFLCIMIPNIIWMIIPSSNDVLRIESITKINDTIMSIFQFIMVALLCFVPRKINIKINCSSIIMIILYFIFWFLYYMGMVHFFVLFGLCIFPCFSFILYEIKSKNLYALIPTIVFTITHLIFTFINFY